MFIQKVLKGIAKIDLATGVDIMNRQGIISNWWNFKGTITPIEEKEVLTESNLLDHLNNYEKPLPPWHPLYGSSRTYGSVTPFISTTAGSIQRSEFYTKNILYNPELIALNFATNNFTTIGCVFHLYLFTLGKKAIPQQQFSEEVRDIFTYTYWLQYFHEGEITAKIHIPSIQIEKVEFYNGPLAKIQILSGVYPESQDVALNPQYENPSKFNNIRELL